MRSINTFLIGLILVIFVISGCVLLQNVKTSITQRDMSLIFTDIASAKIQSVVYIEVGSLESIRKGRGKSGSGVIISGDGYVITNNHVVEGLNEVVVITSNENEYKAKVIGADSQTDVALLKIESDDVFSAIIIGDSDKVKEGEWVIAIGSPFGLFNSVTVGVVSGKNRSLSSGPYDNFIQTDAAINPGSSGGPLLNLKGEIIGINAMIFMRNGQPRNIGVGLAVPINMAMLVVDRLKKSGKVNRAKFGVIIRNITAGLKEEYKLASRKGVLIEDISEGGPADKAGLKKGDVIIRFNGKEAKQVHQLSFMVSMSPIGKEIEVVVIRDNKEKTVMIILESLNPEASFSVSEVEKKFGFAAHQIPEKLAEFLFIKDGVIVYEIVEGGPADKAGLEEDDIILTMDDENIESPEDYVRVMLKLDLRKCFLIKVLRKGVEAEVRIEKEVRINIE